jgi:hypothetical protein
VNLETGWQLLLTQVKNRMEMKLFILSLCKDPYLLLNYRKTITCINHGKKKKASDQINNEYLSLNPGSTTE